MGLNTLLQVVRIHICLFIIIIHKNNIVYLYKFIFIYNIFEVDKEISNLKIKKILNIDNTDYFIIFSEDGGLSDLISINITY